MVESKEAARYLGVRYKTILYGKLEAVRIEARQLIELDTLKAYKFYMQTGQPIGQG